MPNPTPDSHHGHDHGHPLPGGRLPLTVTLLTSGAGPRLALAGGLTALLWAVVAWALA